MYNGEETKIIKSCMYHVYIKPSSIFTFSKLENKCLQTANLILAHQFSSSANSHSVSFSVGNKSKAHNLKDVLLLAESIKLSELYFFVNVFALSEKASRIYVTKAGGNLPSVTEVQIFSFPLFV